MIAGGRGRAVAAGLVVAAAAAGVWWYASGRAAGPAPAPERDGRTRAAGTGPAPGSAAVVSRSGERDAAPGSAAAAADTGGRPRDGEGPREGAGDAEAGPSDRPDADSAGAADTARPDGRPSRPADTAAPPADTADTGDGAATPGADEPTDAGPGARPAQGGPPSAEEVVRRAAAAYDSLRTLRARFRQVLEMRVFEPARRQAGEGTWYQEKPAFLRMDFSDPEGDVIVSDGEHLWLYYPSTHPGQVIRTGLASPGRGAPVVDLQGRIFRQARTAYRPEYRGREEVTGRPAHVLELVPRRPDTQYSRVRVWVDAGTHLLRKLEFHDRSETVRTITLDELEPNVPLPDSLFRFEPPPDAEVFEG